MVMILPENGKSNNRDKPLSFHWKAQNYGWLDRLDLSPAQSEFSAQARASIILEAYLVGRAEPDRAISYSRRKEFYANGQRYRGTPYTCKNVVGSIDEAASLGLLDSFKTAPGRRGRQSTFRATDRLLEAIDQPFPVIFDPCETVRLKDTEGHLVDYRDTARTDRMRRDLNEINEALTATEVDLTSTNAVHKEHTIQCDNHVLYPAMQNLYRVFNRGKFPHGGRLYGGWWQQAHKVDREFLTIDGEATIELDYPCLHPSMLYAMAGKPLTGDPYVIDGWERKLVKVAFNVLINADTERQALGAIAERIGGQGAFEKARKLIIAIKERHSPIADAFGSGAGLRLQRTDADMAEHIVLSLIRKGIIALPIHDSFITKKQDKEALLEIMAEALERFVFVGNSFSTSKGYGISVPHMEGGDPFPCPLPLLILPPDNPSQMDIFRFRAVSVPFNDIQSWHGGVAPDGVRIAARHELKRRQLLPKVLADRIGVSRPQLVNILQGRFGAGSDAAKELREFIFEGAETVGLVG
jgi:hypothetical protein